MSSLGQVLTVNVRWNDSWDNIWLAPSLTYTFLYPRLFCHPNGHCLGRGMKQQETEQRDQFFAFEFQKLWPWQRQNIWKRAGSVRREDFSTSHRLDKESLGFGEKKSRGGISGLGGWDFWVRTWGANSTGVKTRHCSCPQEIYKLAGKMLSRNKCNKVNWLLWQNIKEVDQSDLKIWE